MERNSLFLFKPTASLCVSKKVVKQEYCVLPWGWREGWRKVLLLCLGGWREHLWDVGAFGVGKGGLCFTVQLHVGIGKSCPEQDDGSGMGKCDCIRL